MQTLLFPNRGAFGGGGLSFIVLCKNTKTLTLFFIYINLKNKANKNIKKFDVSLNLALSFCGEYFESSLHQVARLLFQQEIQTKYPRIIHK